MLLLVFSTAAAQDNCPIIVQQALQAVDANCTTTGRNQACYGHVAIESVLSDTSLRFEQSGDIVDVTALSSIALSPMDSGSGHWGMALLRLQADIPDTLPGQNVTLLVFGDVTLTPDEDTVRYSPVDIVAGGNINVRRGPSTDFAVVATLTTGQMLQADAQNAAGTWLRLRLEGDAVGWVRADLVTVQGDSSALAVAEPGDEGRPSYSPMQSFYFRSGVGDAGCAEAPDSGLLIQTPQGVGQVTLRVNEVQIRLGSTAFLQANPDDFLYTYVLEGEAQVSSFGVVKVVPEGAVVTVPLDANLSAAGPPDEPEPYETDAIGMMPTAALEQQIIIAEPAESETITQLNSCTLSADHAAQLYTGPGTNYLALGTLAANVEREPIGQAELNGLRWWQLSSTAWVSDAAVETDGNCDVIAAASIPAAPSYLPPGTSSSVSAGSNFNLWDCNGGVQRVNSAASITVFISHGGGTNYASLEAARSAGLGGWLTINGQSYPINRTGAFTDGIGHHYTLHFDVGVLADGTYYAAGQIASFPIPSCIVVVG